MTDEDLRAKVAALEAENAALEARLARLEGLKRAPATEPTARLGMEGFSPSTYRLIDQATVPKDITDAMTKNVGTEMVQTIVRDGKAR